MERVLFQNLYEHPPLVTSVINPEPEDCVKTIQKAIEQGTDAFIFQLERLNNDKKNEENLRFMFEAAKGFPIMVTNYPYESNQGQSDEKRVALEIEALKAGASCLDIRGDTYDTGAKHELTFLPEAIEKQKETIRKIHELGGQVIMSMHVWEFLTTEQVLAYGKELESRGADIVKIVHMADTPEQLIESIATTYALHQAISVPVLHLLNGKCRELHRFYGTKFGSCLVFCVQEFIEGSSESQPMLDKMVQLRKLTSYQYEGGVK